MEHLLLQLLKLLLRLVLFAWSGDWHKLDKLQAQWREFLEQARKGEVSGQKQAPKRVRVPRAPRKPAPRREGGPPPPQPEVAWPFEFAPEAIEEEPGEELVGGELAARTQLVPTVPRAARRAGKELPLALALREPRMQRDAMVLAAALGRRPGDRGGRIR
jgi:hypothetical protein